MGKIWTPRKKRPRGRQILIVNKPFGEPPPEPPLPPVTSPPTIHPQPPIHTSPPGQSGDRRNPPAHAGGGGAVAPPGPPDSWPWQIHFDWYDVNAAAQEQFEVVHPDPGGPVVKLEGHSLTTVPDWDASPGFVNQHWAAYAGAQWVAWEVALPSAINRLTGHFSAEMLIEDTGGFTRIGIQLQNNHLPAALDEAFGIQWVNGLDYPQSIKYHNGTGTFIAGFTGSPTWTYGEPINSPLVMYVDFDFTSTRIKTHIWGKEDTNQGRQESGLAWKDYAHDCDEDFTYVRFFMDRTTASAHEKGLIECWGRNNATDTIPDGKKLGI